MSLPWSTLLGLLGILVAVEFERPIPGSATTGQLVVFAAVLVVPLLLLGLARHLLVARIVAGRRVPIPPRAMLNLSALTVPLVCWAFFGPGGAGEWIARLDGSATLRFVLYGLPLLAVELPRLTLATVLMQWCELDDELRGGAVVPVAYLPNVAQTWPQVRLRLGWLALLAGPMLLLGGALDLLSLAPRVEAVVMVTGLGWAMASLLFLVVAASVLPWWFRIAFGVQPLPEPLGTRLRAVAERLGFPGHRLFLLPTGNRSLNAMMVGPLPIQRGLGLTDAFVQTLDELALAGVVAHEVGHAQREHPLLLACVTVAVPLLGSSPLLLLDVAAWSSELQALLGFGIVAAVWLAVRTLAHRFEFEADAASVQALGAAPCVHALRTVQAMAVMPRPSLFRRVFTLHPDDEVRQQSMWRYEREPAYREAFERTGRRIRRVLAAVVALAAFTGGWTWLQDWPYERAYVAFHRGDLVAAQQLRAALGDDVPPRWRDGWHRFGEDLAVALELAPTATAWDQVRQPAVAGWPRAVEVLLAQGPAAARPWLVVTVGLDEAAPLVRRALVEYCRAAANGDGLRVEQAAQVVRRLGVPEELRAVFAQ